MSIFQDLLFCLKPRCPVCRQGRLFRKHTITIVDRCDSCGTNLGDHDIGDAAAVFMIFALGFTLVPLAWLVEIAVGLPVWAHLLLWGACMLVLIGVFLPAVKAYIMLLDYRHRPRRKPPESG